MLSLDETVDFVGWIDQIAGATAPIDEITSCHRGIIIVFGSGWLGYISIFRMFRFAECLPFLTGFFIFGAFLAGGVDFKIGIGLSAVMKNSGASSFSLSF